MELKIEKNEKKNVFVIKPIGRIDPLTVEDFDEAIADAIKKGKVKIIIDCSRLEYISSAGLGVLIGYIEEVREKNGDIVICCTNPGVYEIFDLLGFTKVYRFFPGLDKAEKFLENA